MERMERMERRAEPSDVSPQEHRLQLVDRGQLTMTGVREVTAYDAYSATLETACGTLVVGGSGIRVRAFSAESGEASIEGEVEYLQYQGRRKGDRQESFLHRLLR